MRVIWKWRLGRPGKPFTLEIPHGYKIVHAGLDGGTFTEGVSDEKPMPALWAEVFATNEKRPVEFVLVATGQDYEGLAWDHFATLDVAGYFFHLLVKRSTPSRSPGPH